MIFEANAPYLPKKIVGWGRGKVHRSEYRMALSERRTILWKKRPTTRVDHEQDEP